MACHVNFLQEQRIERFGIGAAVSLRAAALETVAVQVDLAACRPLHPVGQRAVTHASGPVGAAALALSLIHICGPGVARVVFTGFMVNTWAEASIMAVVAGAVGFFVVMRGATFAAHAIPQGAFTGAAGAALIGANTLVGVGAFSLFGVVTIARWGRRGRHDVVTALTLVTLLGVGALFLSMSTEYSEQTFSLLFGEPLAVSASEVLPTAAIGAACLVLVVLLYRRLVLSTVAPELAAAQGLSLIHI